MQHYAIEFPSLGIADPQARARMRRCRASTPCRAKTGRRSPIVFWSFRIMVGLGHADVRARGLELWCARGAARCSTRGCCTSLPL